MADGKPGIRTTKVSLLEVFPNPYPDRSYDISIEAPEFTSVCPKTGQPDYATLLITYVPDRACIELKSLKLYLQQYRNRGIFYEDVTNRILDDLVAACAPRHMRLESRWRPRGGIATSVVVAYGSRQP
jgi:7-cyano-7-deazaguanine reductase